MNGQKSLGLSLSTVPRCRRGLAVTLHYHFHPQSWAGNQGEQCQDYNQDVHRSSLLLMAILCGQCIQNSLESWVAV